MSLKLKRVLAVLVLIALVFGWYVTLFGIGDKTKDGAITSVKSALKYGLDIDGGVYVVMKAKTDLTGDELKKLMEQTRAVLDNRVNQMGVAESSVTIEGTNRLRVEIPGVEDAEDAIKAIGKTAQLYFILADGSVVLDGSHVKDAQIATDGSYYKILLDFDSEGAALFEEGTRKAFNREVTSTIEGVESNQIAIVLDNEIVVHPNVNSVISGGSCEMTGNYTKEDASMTAALIRGGALPVELEEVQSSHTDGDHRRTRAGQVHRGRRDRSWYRIPADADLLWHAGTDRRHRTAAVRHHVHVVHGRTGRRYDLTRHCGIDPVYRYGC